VAHKATDLVYAIREGKKTNFVFAPLLDQLYSAMRIDLGEPIN